MSLLSCKLYDQPDQAERATRTVRTQGGRAMAVLLDGSRLMSQTRTERLLQAITLDAVLKCAPVASIAGVPLAIVFAKDYTIGYANHLGIPSEFVKAEPTAAVGPFAIITGL